MEELLKLCSISFVGVTVVSLLKKNLPEMSVVASVSVLLAVSAFSYGILQQFFDFMTDIASRVHISEALFLPLIKTTGISIISKIACDMCREGGLISVASYIEMISGAIAISFSFPLIERLLSQFLG